jgi:hypothetical protein
MAEKLFQCAEGDFEGDLAGSINHVQLTGHLVTKDDHYGNVVRVELEPEDDADPYGGGGDE